MRNAMEILNDELLREELIMNIEVLNKVKELLLLPNTEYMTTKMVADYYEVDTLAIQKIVQRHNSELEIDGIESLKGKEVLERVGQDVHDVKKAKGYSEIVTENLEIKIAHGRNIIFTKRAVLRVGMLLRDSDIAQEVRTQLLNIAVRADEKEVKAIIEEEEVLRMALVTAKNEDEMLMAAARLDLFRRNTIAQLKNENEVLAKEIVFLDNPDVFKKIVKRIHYILKGSVENHISFYYNEVYSLLKDKHGINLWTRRGKAKKPFCSFIKEEEWATAISIATALASRYSVDISDIIK